MPSIRDIPAKSYGLRTVVPLQTIVDLMNKSHREPRALPCPNECRLPMDRSFLRPLASKAGLAEPQGIGTGQFAPGEIPAKAVCNLTHRRLTGANSTFSPLHDDL
jgi:hypothetical protein